MTARRVRAVKELLLIHGVGNGAVIAVVTTIDALASATSTSFAQGTLFMSNLPVLLAFVFLVPALLGRLLGDGALREGDLGHRLVLGGRSIVMPYVILMACLVMLADMGGYYLWGLYDRVRDAESRQFDSTAELVDQVDADGDVERAFRDIAIHLPGAVPIAEYAGAVRGRGSRFEGGPSQTWYWSWPLFTRLEISENRARVPAHVWVSDVTQGSGTLEPPRSDWFVALTGQSVDTYREAILAAQDGAPLAEPTLVLVPIRSPPEEAATRWRHLRLAFIWGNLGPLIAFALWALARRLGA